MQCLLCDHPKAHKHGKMQERTSTLSLPYLQANLLRILRQLVLPSPCEPWTNQTSSTSAQRSSVAYEGLVGQLDLLTTRLWVLFEPPARRHNLFIMQKYKPCKLSKWVRMRCGHLFQKTETVLHPRARDRRLLDRFESSWFQWLNSGSASWLPHALNWLIS